VERAILWGFDVSHLDSHMGTMQLRPEFFDAYLDLAVEFGLPIRLSGASTERSIGFPFRQLAADEGIVFPDHLVLVPGVGSRRVVERAVMDLRPGVTEVLIHPAIDTPELRASTPDWASRVDDHDLALISIADLIGTRVHHAAGFNTACTRIIYVDPSTFVISPKAKAEDFVGDKVPFTPEMLTKALETGRRNEKGEIRAGLSEFLPGKPLGPWRDFGVRPDDPNDVIPHEDRRASARSPSGTASAAGAVTRTRSTGRSRSSSSSRSACCRGRGAIRSSRPPAACSATTPPRSSTPTTTAPRIRSARTSASRRTMPPGARASSRASRRRWSWRSSRARGSPTRRWSAS
jgi:hypothetical protein